MRFLTPLVFTVLAAVLVTAADDKNKKAAATYKDGQLTFNGKTLPKLPFDGTELEKVFGKPSNTSNVLSGKRHVYDDLGIEVQEDNGKVVNVTLAYGGVLLNAKKPYAGTVKIGDVVFDANSDVAALCKKLPAMKQDADSPAIWRSADRSITVWGKPTKGLDSITFAAPEAPAK